MKNSPLQKTKIKYLLLFLFLTISVPAFLWGYPYVSNKLHFEPYRYVRDIRPYPPEQDIKIQDLTSEHRTSSYTCQPFECRSHQEFYIKNCNIRVDGSKPHGVSPNTSMKVPENNLCEIFTRWIEKDGRIKLAEPTPQLPYIQLRFTVFNDYVSSGSVDFFNANGEETRSTAWRETGLLFEAKKIYNSSYIFDFMIREILETYK
jgi:hypothetical protein